MSKFFMILKNSFSLFFFQIFIHMLPPYLCMLRPKVETPLSLQTVPRKEKKMVAINKGADEYFIRKPDSSVLFPKPNR